MLPQLLLAASMAATSALAPQPPPKLVLLDRDGVVNVDVGSPGVVDQDQFQLTPDCAAAIGTLKRQGCAVAVVTNQSCVGKGLLSEAGLGEIHAWMERLLLEGDANACIDKIYVCTSVDEADHRKKPNPGMIYEVCRDFGIDPVDAAFVGDTLTDMQAAKAGGVERRVLVETGYGLGLMGGKRAAAPADLVEEFDPPSSPLNEVTPFLYATNLAEAVRSITGCST